MKAAATRLSNQVLQEKWISEPEKKSNSEAKISYLMVEQITPPEYLWDKISNKLDKDQHKTTTAKSVDLTKTATVAIMVAAASTAIAVILYWLL